MCVTLLCLQCEYIFLHLRIYAYVNYCACDKLKIMRTAFLDYNHTKNCAVSRCETM